MNRERLTLNLIWDNNSYNGNSKRHRTSTGLPDTFYHTCVTLLWIPDMVSITHERLTPSSSPPPAQISTSQSQSVFTHLCNYKFTITRSHRSRWKLYRRLGTILSISLNVALNRIIHNNSPEATEKDKITLSDLFTSHVYSFTNETETTKLYPNPRAHK